MLPFDISMVWLLFFVITIYASLPTSLENALSALVPHLSPGALITLPHSPRWPALQIRSSYPAVVEVATESDVIATVTFANRFNVPFLAISGAHGWSRTLNRMEYGIQINMRELNGIVLRKGGQTADVGGGALQWEVTRSLYGSGKYAGEFGKPSRKYVN
jgi:FAD/FMN-containing dehydrogenase